MHKIYSIVVTYNGIQWVEKCISSLVEASMETSIIIVDNGSTDGTQDLIRTKFDQVRLIQSQQNLGFGQANNIGLSIALKENADAVFLLNQDAWIEKETLEILYKAQQNSPEFVVLSPIHLNGRGDGLDENFKKYLEQERVEDLVAIYSDNHDHKIYEVKFINAAAWLLSRQALEKIGGFNPAFFMYGEDDNYLHRVYYHKFKAGIVTNSFIFHDRTVTKHRNDYNGYNSEKIVNASHPGAKKDVELSRLKKLILKSRLSLDNNNRIVFEKTLRQWEKVKPAIDSNRKISAIPGPAFLLS